ncbi:hypothetical protein, partial [Parabacteroides distasonis]
NYLLFHLLVITLRKYKQYSHHKKQPAVRKRLFYLLSLYTRDKKTFNNKEINLLVLTKFDKKERK